jgi:hypothetical protein
MIIRNKINSIFSIIIIQKIMTKNQQEQALFDE